LEETKEAAMSKLFEESRINQMRLKNRFVRSATWEGLATPEGEVTPELIDMMVSLAKGGVGLIISSHAFVSPEGQASPRQLGIYHDKLVPGLKKMTSAVHENGGKIVLQLAHGGRHAEEKLTGRPVLTVSDSSVKPIIKAFSDAAKRALDAGFDGIQIHSAHGYFLSQFLSPAYNNRQDEYGGSIANRAKIHLRIYDAVREFAGDDYPILIKMNCADFIENGLEGEESLQAAKIFADAGFDAIEVSGGTITSGKLSPSRTGIIKMEKEAYFKEYAQMFRSKISTPLILVGGMRSFEVADKIVEEKIADYISMSRPLIREPDLINRWRDGDRRKAGCTSDNLCFKPAIEGKGVYCVELIDKGR
jgi:2,4-dienoyl-CoA reductase-like NADH-dependent reductase (Old Yellow Enzyme family)